MRLLIVSPGGELQEGSTRTGNRSTATQWGRLLEDLGHEVEISSEYTGHGCDIMIALHAEKSAPAIQRYRETHPEGKLILGLAGTDIYPDPGPMAVDSIDKADGIIALQRKAVEKIPDSQRHKATVILQSAIPCSPAPDKSRESFDVSILGHLRAVKDPLLLAKASRNLPKSSRIRILQAGDIIEERYRAEVERETETNPRYRYLGQLNRQSTATLIASSHVMCLTSINEGGARVVGEAIVNSTPVLSTHMDGSIGMLGEEYPGYFPVGDADALAEQLAKCENDPDFLETISEAVTRLAPYYSPDQERKALADLLARINRLK